MPMQWTAEADRRLLLTIVNNFSIDFSAVADAYAREHGQSEGQPSKGAITQHLAKLRGPVKGGVKSPARKMIAAPKIPNNKSKPAASSSAAKTTTKQAITTTTTGAKRKKTNTSDDEESELDVERELSADLGRRASLSRRSKSAKLYHDGDSSEDADDESDNGLQSVQTNGGDLEDGLFDQSVNFDGAANANAKDTPMSGTSANSRTNAKPTPNKQAAKATIKEESEDDSDISDFDPLG